LDATNASVVDEAMQTDAASRQRLLQNLGMAQGVQNQGLSEQTNMQNYGLNLNQQNLNASALQNTALNQSMTLAEQQRQAQLQAQANAAQLYGQSRIDPYAGVLSGTNNNAYGLLNTVYGTTTPSANAYLNYGQDLNNTNYNAQAAANIANANNQAGMNSGFISAGSNILGKFIGNMDTSIKTTPTTPTPKGKYDVSIP
jgi:hypothetical protein